MTDLIASTDALPVRACLVRSSREIPNARAQEHASDHAAIKRLQLGDKEALGILYDRYSRTILSVGLRILRDRSEAEDLVQEVFVYIVRKSNSFDSAKGPFASWLLQIAYCRALDRRNYLIARKFYDYCNIDEIIESGGGAHPSTENLAERLELKRVFEQAFAQLTGAQKRTLELFFAQGYSLREISIQMAETLANVRNHYYRGLKRLRSVVMSVKS